MSIIPNNKQDWLRFGVFPFKAYAVIAPISFLISLQLPRPPHSGALNEEIFLILNLFPCALILLFAAASFALAGPKGFALSCLGFSVAALVIGLSLLPHLANA